jgi:putative DNA primase/helicase
MEEVGLVPPSDPIADGKHKRFRVENDKPGQRSGWYRIYPDFPYNGRFGNWKTGECYDWRGQPERGMDPADRDALRRRMDEARAERELAAKREAENAARRARRLWVASASVDPAHPYLCTKQVGAYGIRQYRDRLVVPVRGGDGDLRGLQFIGPDGTKRFMAGTHKKGCYHSMGCPGDTIVVAEGYATAATVHEATGFAVAVAFDAGNLQPVAEVLAGKYLGAEIIIAADNDEGTDGNPGLTAASAAARVVGGRVVAPPPERQAA